MPEELLGWATLTLLLASFGVGIAVGLTGMGGGALMTPALVFLGIPPSAAIANDLVAAALTKSVGAAVHARRGSPDHRLALLLAVGSVPAALAGTFLLGRLGPGGARESFLRSAIGVALIGTAAAYALRAYGVPLLRGGTDPTMRIVRVVPTVLIGCVGGLLVGLTSVGSGSVIMVALLLLNPSLSPRTLVGTDLLQAVPLVVAAAVGHLFLTGVDPAVLLSLVLGGVPGTYLGARLAGVVPVGAVRQGIVLVLLLTGMALLGASPGTIGGVGAALVVFGPVVSALVHRRLARHRGLTPGGVTPSPSRHEQEHR